MPALRRTTTGLIALLAVASVSFVVAYDAAGNVSAHTNTVAVPKK